jgi:hypothetical protein
VVHGTEVYSAEVDPKGLAFEMFPNIKKKKKKKKKKKGNGLQRLNNNKGMSRDDNVIVVSG